jgi:hypothetical protein
MDNRFLDLLTKEDVVVNYKSDYWIVDIPAELLASDEIEALTNKWDMPHGRNTAHAREKMYEQAAKNRWPKSDF